MKAATKEKLAARRVWRLCAAAECAFAEHGSPTLVKDILEAAKMSRRDFYETFRSLEHILARLTFAADAFDRVARPDWIGYVVPSADHMLCAMSLDATRGRDMSGTDFNLAFASRRKRVEIGPEKVPADEEFLLWYAKTVTSG